jgi:hypothetical protein
MVIDFWFNSYGVGNGVLNAVSHDLVDRRRTVRKHRNKKMYFTDWTKNSSSFTLRNEIEDPLYVIG